MKLGRQLAWRALLPALIVLGVLAAVALGGNPFRSAALPGMEPAEAGAPPAVSGAQAMQLDPVLLEQASFSAVAESAELRLSVHEPSGHFRVEDKRSGQIYRSYPNPAHWPAEQERSSGIWPQHLSAPFMYTYIRPEARQDQELEGNWLQQQGIIEAFAVTDGGYALTYAIPSQGLRIPITVTLQDDFVEVSILDHGLEESEAYRLGSISLFPFLGADYAAGQEGYLLLPDGPGALVYFREQRPQAPAAYGERIYGADPAFSNRRSSSGRSAVRMPVFGLKSGEAAVFGVVAAGEEYADIAADPNNNLTAYNWVAARQQYRSAYFQPTDSARTTGYFTYSKERFGADRAVRYYFLAPDKADYAGMAERMRHYLMAEQGMQPLGEGSEGGAGGKGGEAVSLHLILTGGDRRSGFLGDGYVAATTTEQASAVVEALHSSGIAEMEVVYSGWQAKGFSSAGALLPVARQLGGNSGMRRFVSDAAALGVPVYLDAAGYGYNSGTGGFNRRRDGLRDLAMTVIEAEPAGGKAGNGAAAVYASPRLLPKRLAADLKSYQSLGIAGLVLGQGVGASLSSDFNSRHSASRSEAKQLQEELFATAEAALGDVRATDGNLYAWYKASHIYDLVDEYSYDQFVDEEIPFVQMVLHGLATYSGAPANLRDDYRLELLKSIEYGAEPAFTLTYAPSASLIRTYGLGFLYSSHYRDWLERVQEEYRLFNEALGPVRGAFITGHRTVAPGVKEVAYSNGITIVVNYNADEYTGQGYTVAAEHFAVYGGEGR